MRKNKSYTKLLTQMKLFKNSCISVYILASLFMACESLSDHTGQVSSFQARADSMYEVGKRFKNGNPPKLDSALYCYTEALKISLENEYKLGQINAYNGLSLTYKKKKKPDSVFLYYKLGSRIEIQENQIPQALKVKTFIKKAYIHQNYGNFLRTRDLYEEAISELSEAEKWLYKSFNEKEDDRSWQTWYDRIDLSVNIGLIYKNQAEDLIARGKEEDVFRVYLASALEYYDRGLDLIEHVKPKPTQLWDMDSARAEIMNKKSAVFRLQGEWDAAQELLENSIDIYTKNKKSRLLGITYIYLSHNLSAAGHLEEALAISKEAGMRIPDTQEEYGNLADLYLNRAIIRTEQGEDSLAQAAYLSSYSFAKQASPTYPSHKRLKLFSALREVFEKAEEPQKAEMYSALERESILQQEMIKIRRDLFELEKKTLVEKEVIASKNQMLKLMLTGLIAGIVLLISWIVNARIKTRLKQKLSYQLSIESIQKVREKSLRDSILFQEVWLKRIGTDLHQNLGGLLTLISLSVESIWQALSTPSDEVEKRYLHTRDLVKKAMEIARKFPPEEKVMQRGLLQAIEELRNSWEFTPGAPKLSIFPHNMRSLKMAREDETRVFRAIKECLNNVLRHAAATEVILDINHLTEELNIIITDNGKGFDPRIAKPGIGSRNIEGQMKMLQAKFEIESQPGQGATAIMKIPLATNSLTDTYG